jgi:uncharacterized protein (TIGR02246 family)
MATTIADENIKDVIIKKNEIFMETFKKGDAKGMGELYTEDGQVLPPNGHTVKGRHAVGDFWGATMDMGVKSIKLTTDEVELCGDMAFEVSQAELYGEGEHMLDEMKYIVIWKKVNGEWMLHRDMFSSNRAAQ